MDQIVLPPKRTKISRQPTLFDLVAPGQSVASNKPKQPFSAARARKIKIYKYTEIGNSTGMTKGYKEFWNEKAEELCQSFR